MNRIEELLRQAYQEAADTVRPDGVRQGVPRPAPRRGRGGLTTFAPLAAAIAVVLAIAAAVAIPRLLASPSATGYPASAATPPFVAQLPYTGTATAELVVQAAGTRHVTGTVPPPPGRKWSAVAATGSYTTFVVAATDQGQCVTTLYNLTLTGSGKPHGLTALDTPTISGRLDPGALAASANGRTIAFATAACPQNPMARTIGVITLDSPRQMLAMPTVTVFNSLSLTSDGTLLGYAVSTSLTTIGASAGTLPVSSLSGGQTFDRGHGAIMAVTLSADGRTVYAITAVSTSGKKTGGPPYAVTLATYRASDGKFVRSLHTWQNVPMLLSPQITIGGGKLLVWGITQPDTIEVDPATGATSSFWMYTPDGEFPVSVAW
jgi:hypothetical protein